MSKILAILFILFFITPRLIFAQSATPLASPGSVATRNTLFLLGNPQNGEVHFTRFNKRFGALLKRLIKINNRIEKRVAKLNISVANLKKINSQTEKLNSDITELQKNLKNSEETWRKIKSSKNKGEYLELKKILLDYLSKSEKIMSDQKTLVSELKKYKTTSEVELK